MNTNELNEEKQVMDTCGNNNFSNADEKTSVITSDYLKANTTIKGWLLLYLILTCVGPSVSLILALTSFSLEDCGGSYFLAFSDIATFIVILLLACYVIYSFYNRKPDAVFLAKIYTVTLFAFNLFVLGLGEYETTGIGSLNHIIRSLIYTMVWFSFLCFSRQVAEVIPKSFRKRTAKDYYIIAIVALIPLFFYSAGTIDLINKEANPVEEPKATLVLVENEYTDGKVIFTRPEGFVCEKKELTNPQLTFYELESENNATITCCSDFETDYSASSFNEYWANWQDERIADYPSQEVINEKYSINGHPYFYKALKYRTEDESLYWRFILMTNAETGKICLLSCYDNGDDDYVDEILNTIRFI